ncbi:MAG: rRNA pseudouridine synthase [Culturomica sp.]|jgi:23S rRNA pseudouridine2605 synthase|nr:rRNA pseudouridine synthase [Culturomica sp.]
MEQKKNQESGDRREGAHRKYNGTGNRTGGNRPRIYRRDDTRPDSRNDSGTPDRRPGSRPSFRSADHSAKEELRQSHYSKKKQLEHRIKQNAEAAELRLNRYISVGGICSRRDADALITEGRVKVNGAVVQTVGIKVKRTDKVEVDGQVVMPEKKVYLVLNKPKDYVTTVEDPKERKTVMSLIEGACKERIYPVGRLDRQTSGVLLFTNDGDLTKKLTHPKHEHKKIYHVFLDKPLEPGHLEMIGKGIELEDGPIKADEISYVSTDRTEVGIEVHSGRNRIVRRIFEHLNYRITRLDRVYFAGITKKNLPRGRWRFLTPQEVNILKVYKKI